MSNLNGLTRERIHEKFFETISSSCNWEDDYEGKRYYDYVTGVVDITQRLLCVLDEIDKTIAHRATGRAQKSELMG